MGEEVIPALARRFAQLYIKPEKDVSQSDLYRAITRKGQHYQGTLDHFMGSCEDSLTVEHTPAGDVMVIFLKHRSDFECFYRIMACRCEPVPVPATMGACYLSGLNDWSRIHEHMDAYKLSGGQDVRGEFARFTADPANYKQTMILLSEGPYSAVPASNTPYPEDQWLQISRKIRKYHELTHFICRQRFPQKKNPLWDEILADCMGLLFATGQYDLTLAQTFLGIQNGAYVGGRLENYLDAPVDEKTVQWVTGVMYALSQRCEAEQKAGNSGFDLLEILEQDADSFCIVKQTDISPI